MAAPMVKSCLRLYCNSLFGFTSRNYCRKLRRNPVNVLTPEKASNLNDKRSKIRHVDDVVREPLNLNKQEEKTSFPYEKLSENDIRLTKPMMEIKSKKSRRKSNKVLLEGKRLIIDALQSGAVPEQIYFSKVENVEDVLKVHNLDGVKLYKIVYRHMQIWSDLTTSPGILGIFKHPSNTHLQYNRTKCYPINLICDNVRDPGNLGVIIRCAASAGCDKIILTKGCVDPWDTKVLRASSGAHFRVPILTNIGWEAIENYCSPKSNVILADNSEEYAQMDNKEVDDLKMVMGNEISQQEEEVTDYEIKEDGFKVYKDENYLNENQVEKYRKIGIKSELYSQIKLNSDEVTIVVGGETEGLSGAAFRLAHRRGGLRAHVPMENKIDSLNCAIATGIILYEIRRNLINYLDKQSSRLHSLP